MWGERPKPPPAPCHISNNRLKVIDGGQVVQMLDASGRLGFNWMEYKENICAEGLADELRGHIVRSHNISRRFSSPADRMMWRRFLAW